jgi:hypothetical protein
LEGQDDYFLTSVESSLEFIRDISAKDLTIDPKEYEERYNEAKVKLE